MTNLSYHIISYWTMSRNPMNKRNPRLARSRAKKLSRNQRLRIKALAQLEWGWIMLIFFEDEDNVFVIILKYSQMRSNEDIYNIHIYIFQARFFHPNFAKWAWSPRLWEPCSSQDLGHRHWRPLDHDQRLSRHLDTVSAKDGGLEASTQLDARESSNLLGRLPVQNVVFEGLNWPLTPWWLARIPVLVAQESPCVLANAMVPWHHHFLVIQISTEHGHLRLAGLGSLPRPPERWEDSSAGSPILQIMDDPCNGT